MANVDSMTWDDIQPVAVDDAQTGRNVYIEIKQVGGVYITKSSAGKIIECIEEGFMPVYKDKTENEPVLWSVHGISFACDNSVYILNIFTVTGETIILFSDPNGDLSKPFTSIEPSQS